MFNRLRLAALASCCLLVLTMATKTSAQTSWQQAMGLNGGTVNALMSMAESDLWAGTNVGLFYSSDNGQHWVQQGFKSATVYALTHVDDTLYAGIGYSDEDGFGGVFRSIDHGVTWQKNLEGREVWSLSIERGRLFVGTAQHGVFRSSDGVDWTQFLDGTSVYAIHASGNSVIVATDSAVFRSDDGGDHWKPNALSAHGTVYCFCSVGSVLYAGGDYGLFQSTDDGESWSAAALHKHTINALLADSTRLYVGTDDAGVQTIQLGSTSPDSSNIGDESVYALSLASQHVFAGTWEDGVFTSKDNAKVFDNTSIGLTAASMSVFAQSDSTLFAAGDGVAMSTDGGQSWEWMSLYDQVHALWVSGDTIMAFCDDGMYRNVARSKDWEAVALTNETVTCALKDSVSFCGTRDHGVFRSDDGGMTWYQTALTSGTVHALMHSNGLLFAAMADGHVLRSDDGGKYWSSALYDSTAAIISFQTLSKSFVVGTDGDDVFFSSDNGLIWQHRLLNSILQTSVRNMCWDGNAVYAATFGAGVYASTDDAWNWDAINDNLGSHYCLGIASYNHTVLCSTVGQGIWYRDQLVNVAMSRTSATTRCSPNPVQSWARVQCAEPIDNLASCQLVNVQGQIVDSEHRFESGSASELMVDCRDLAAGVYVVRIPLPSTVLCIPLVVVH